MGDSGEERREWGIVGKKGREWWIVGKKGREWWIVGKKRREGKKGRNYNTEWVPVIASFLP